MKSIPTELQYTSSHEWVRVEQDGTFTLGITHHAQSLLGDIVYVELPDLKKTVAKGDSCAVVESVKAAADVYTPFNGEITEVNQNLTSQPELINMDPYGEGWLWRMRLPEGTNLTHLMSAKDYEQSVANV